MRSLALSWVAAQALEVEKRALFLDRVAAALTLRDRITDGDVDRAVQEALQGLVHEPTA
jgi:hypothetical protein